MVGDIDVAALILLEGFIEEVGHLRAVDAALAGELFDERRADEIVVGDVKLRCSGASGVGLLSVHLGDGGCPGDACPLCFAAAQLGGYDGASVAWYGFGQLDGEGCGGLGSFALHGYLYALDGFRGEVMDVESSLEVCFGRYGLGMEGVLGVCCPSDECGGVVVEQGKDEECASVGILCPCVFGEVHPA